MSYRWNEHNSHTVYDDSEWRARRLLALRRRHERVSSTVAILGFATMTAVVALALQMNLRELMLTIMATTLVAAAASLLRRSTALY